MRIKGHRSFDYLHKNSVKYYGKYMNIKVAPANNLILKSHNVNPIGSRLRIAISISSKVSKKSVTRNKLRRLMQSYIFNKLDINKINNPKWALINLKGKIPLDCNQSILNDCSNLLYKAGLLL